jgi:5'-AMP-activated protein kinase catalytic alpha subunit
MLGGAGGTGAAVSHYAVGKTIGEGTFGKVKKGIHKLTGVPVAIKILEKNKIVDLADVERVKREIHILIRIDHPNVIRLYEVIDSPKHIFLIMEFAPGGELFDHIVACGRVKEREACRFLHQIVNGVDYCHKQGVIHRDLKPENLLLDKITGIKIVDFGLGNLAHEGTLL